MFKPAFKFMLLALGLAATLSACRPEAPVEGEEEIDTVRLIIAGQTIEWKVDDSQAPTVNLAANDTFSVEIEFWNLADNENVTEEIRAEDDEHLVCYTADGFNLTINTTDTDGMHPVGLQSEWISGAPSTGTLIIELRHQPGEKDGSCTPGDTDVQADFEIVIQ